MGTNALSISAITAKSTELEGKYLTFRTDGRLFGIPVADVVQIIGVQTITAIPEYPAYAKGIINVRGSIIPVVDIRLRFDLPEVPYDERTCILITTVAGQLIGFIVESVNEVSNIPDSEISLPPRISEYSANAYLTGISRQENQLVLLLDTQKLVDSSAF